MKPKEKYLETGKIVSTHGLRGDMNLVYWSDDAEFLKQFKYLYIGKNKEKVKVTKCSPHKNLILLHIEGTETIEDAQKLRNTIVYIDRDDAQLPEGSYFFEDLIGLEVRDEASGEVYGEITDIQHTGANDIYEVTKGKRRVWIPAIPLVVKNTDTENGVMIISPMEGLFDD